MILEADAEVKIAAHHARQERRNQPLQCVPISSCPSTGSFTGSMMGGGNPFAAFGGFKPKGGSKIPPGPVKTYDTTAEKVDEDDQKR